MSSIDGIRLEACQFNTHLTSNKHPSFLVVVDDSGNVSPTCLAMQILNAMSEVESQDKFRYDRFWKEAPITCLLAALQCTHAHSEKVIERLCDSGDIFKLLDFVEMCYFAIGNIKMVSTASLTILFRECCKRANKEEEDGRRGRQRMKGGEVTDFVGLSRRIMCCLCRLITIELGAASAKTNTCLKVIEDATSVHPRVFLEPLKKMLLLMYWKRLELDDEQVKLPRIATRYKRHLEGMVQKKIAALNKHHLNVLFEELPLDSWQVAIKELLFSGGEIVALFVQDDSGVDYEWSPLWEYIATEKMSGRSFYQSMFSGEIWARLQPGITCTTGAEDTDVNMTDEINNNNNSNNNNIDTPNVIDKFSQVCLSGSFICDLLATEASQEQIDRILPLISKAANLIEETAADIILSSTSSSSFALQLWKSCLSYIVHALSSAGVLALSVVNDLNTASTRSDFNSWNDLELSLVRLAQKTKAVTEAASSSVSSPALVLQKEFIQSCLIACRDAVGVVFIAVLNTLGLPSAQLHEFEPLILEAASHRSSYAPLLLSHLPDQHRQRMFFEILLLWSTVHEGGGATTTTCPLSQQLGSIASMMLMGNDNNNNAAMDDGDERAMALALSREMIHEETDSSFHDNKQPSAALLQLYVSSSSVDCFSALYLKGGLERARTLEYWVCQWTNHFLDAAAMLSAPARVPTAFKQLFAHYSTFNPSILPSNIVSSMENLRTALNKTCDGFYLHSDIFDLPPNNNNNSNNNNNTMSLFTPPFNRKRKRPTSSTTPSQHPLSQSQRSLLVRAICSSREKMTQRISMFLSGQICGGDGLDEDDKRQVLVDALVYQGVECIQWFNPTSVDMLNIAVQAASQSIHQQNREDPLFPLLQLLQQCSNNNPSLIESISANNNNNDLVQLLLKEVCRCHNSAALSPLDSIMHWNKNFLTECLKISPGLGGHLSTTMQTPQMLPAMAECCNNFPEQVARIWSNLLSSPRIPFKIFPVLANMLSLCEKPVCTCIYNTIARKLASVELDRDCSSSLDSVSFTTSRVLITGQLLSQGDRGSIISELQSGIINDTSLKDLFYFLLAFPRSHVSGGNNNNNNSKNHGGCLDSMREAVSALIGGGAHSERKRAGILVDCVLNPIIATRIDSLQAICAVSSAVCAEMEKRAVEKGKMKIFVWVLDEVSNNQVKREMEMSEMLSLVREGSWVCAIMKGDEASMHVNVESIEYGPILLDILGYGSEAVRISAMNFGIRVVKIKGKFARDLLVDASGRTEVLVSKEQAMVMEVACENVGHLSATCCEQLWKWLGSKNAVTLQEYCAGGIYLICSVEMTDDKMLLCKEGMRILTRIDNVVTPIKLLRRMTSDCNGVDAAKMLAQVVPIVAGYGNDSHWSDVVSLCVPLFSLPAAKGALSSAFRRCLSLTTQQHNTKLVPFQRAMSVLLKYHLIGKQ